MSIKSFVRSSFIISQLNFGNRIISLFLILYKLGKLFFVFLVISCSLLNKGNCNKPSSSSKLINKCILIIPISSSSFNSSLFVLNLRKLLSLMRELYFFFIIFASNKCFSFLVILDTLSHIFSISSSVNNSFVKGINGFIFLLIQETI